MKKFTGWLALFLGLSYASVGVTQELEINAVPSPDTLVSQDGNAITTLDDVAVSETDGKTARTFIEEQGGGIVTDQLPSADTVGKINYRTGNQDFYKTISVGGITPAQATFENYSDSAFKGNYATLSALPSANAAANRGTWAWVYGEFQAYRSILNTQSGQYEWVDVDIQRIVAGGDYIGHYDNDALATPHVTQVGDLYNDDTLNVLKRADTFTAASGTPTRYEQIRFLSYDDLDATITNTINANEGRHEIALAVIPSPTVVDKNNIPLAYDFNILHRRGFYSGADRIKVTLLGTEVTNNFNPNGSQQTINMPVTTALTTAIGALTVAQPTTATVSVQLFNNSDPTTLLGEASFAMKVVEGATGGGGGGEVTTAQLNAERAARTAADTALGTRIDGKRDIPPAIPEILPATISSGAVIQGSYTLTLSNLRNGTPLQTNSAINRLQIQEANTGIVVHDAFWGYSQNGNQQVHFVIDNNEANSIGNLGSAEYIEFRVRFGTGSGGSFVQRVEIDRVYVAIGTRGEFTASRDDIPGYATAEPEGVQADGVAGTTNNVSRGNHRHGLDLQPDLAFNVSHELGLSAARKQEISDLQSEVAEIERHGSLHNIRLFPRGGTAKADIVGTYTFEAIDPQSIPSAAVSVVVTVSNGLLGVDASAYPVAILRNYSRTGGPREFSITQSQFSSGIDLLTGITDHFVFEFRFYNAAGLPASVTNPASANRNGALLTEVVDWYIGDHAPAVDAVINEAPGTPSPLEANAGNASQLLLRGADGNRNLYRVDIEHRSNVSVVWATMTTALLRAVTGNNALTWGGEVTVNPSSAANTVIWNRQIGRFLIRQQLAGLTWEAFNMPRYLGPFADEGDADNHATARNQVAEWAGNIHVTTSYTRREVDEYHYQQLNITNNERAKLGAYPVLDGSATKLVAADGTLKDIPAPGAGGLNQGQVDARIAVPARAGNTTRWAKSKVPDDTVYDAEIADFQTATQVTAIANARARARYTDGEKTKLAGITAGAEPNVGVEYTQGEKTKLAGVETGATADQTAAQIKTAYESNSDTNAYTNADRSRVAGLTNSAIDTRADNRINNVAGITGLDVVSLDNTRSGATNRLSVWQGTKAQYDAIVSKDANTLYIFPN